MEGYMDGIESVRYFLPEGHGKEKTLKFVKSQEE